ncbi:hypothetical protein EN794_046115 [Mesorhizobium sp. M00.F.Ca.ET.151.01.1.1]|nr:hypothetical protein EOA35_31530 [Mesorhizobium sp. M8A.F.Ca.ET.023.01.1.1]RWC75254.1 MAG: hypothetical protein EOS71_12740 [Mesorhizobium sp.]TGR28948.1 hypothetical protein EN845_11300 [Mesorhizobium sp. M8A.F.Ca.ET.202.01.1.1]TGR29826.1 hypothetical protein EN840_09055 [Mesorhizobium sp. M8A.F.Ca.ET.197.01.1.1]TGR47235.1 hypothetical protein EN842_23020 [bacterium M00.F.Ca.ET.199.01.1.1]TGR55257.1 hypothetical protein EN841_08135 [Mesorhizobium sp. M8A.F.Ca.ET.198.01.1.1]TGU36686.1 hypo
MSFRPNAAIFGVSAAPHCPAGHLSPYSDGERGPAATPVVFLQRLRLAKSATVRPSPVTIRGEDAGRQVRGGADAGHYEQLL